MAPYGAVSFAKPDLTPLVTYGIETPRIMMIGYTYMYEGDRETGLDLLYKIQDNAFIKFRHGWDLRVMISGPPDFTEETEEGREGQVARHYLSCRVPDAQC